VEAIIRPYSESDSIEALTDLLHRAYAVLAEQGLRFVASHQDSATTRRRIESGFGFVAVVGTSIVGTVTVYTETADSACAYYRRPGVARFGQFAVDPALQGAGLGRRLLDSAEAYALGQGCSEIALDTAEGADALIRLYERWGYAIVDRVDWDATNYVSVVMAKRLEQNLRV
jgi:GNAT superfamily N-acetyltransferase